MVMHEILYSPYIVPLGAFVVGIAYYGFSTWRKVREREMNLESEIRQKEMDHQHKMKAMDLEIARTKESKREE
jgi:hypothetical protein